MYPPAALQATRWSPFVIGGCEPRTVTDFEVCKRHGLNKTIADTLKPGGICARCGLSRICGGFYEDMMEVCPKATTCSITSNPMAMNTRAMHARYPHIKQWSACAILGTGNGGRTRRATEYRSRPLRAIAAPVLTFTWRFTLELEAQTADENLCRSYPELLAAHDV